MIVAEAQFLLRADHRLVVDAAQRAALEDHALWLVAVAVPDLGAFHGERRPQRPGQRAGVLVLKQVRRAGDAFLRGRAAVLHHGDHQAIGVGMGLDFHDLAQDDLLPVPDQVIGRRDGHAGHASLGHADVGDLAHFQPGQRQALGQRLSRHVRRDVHVVFEPTYRDEHRRCKLLVFGVNRSICLATRSPVLAASV